MLRLRRAGDGRGQGRVGDEHTIADVNDAVREAQLEAALGCLDETLDSLFAILDDPRCRKLHPATRKAVQRIVVKKAAQREEPQGVNKLVANLGVNTLIRKELPAVQEGAAWFYVAVGDKDAPRRRQGGVRQAPRRCGAR